MKSKGSEPPSLFDNLDLFAQAAENEAEKGEPKEIGKSTRLNSSHAT